MDRVSRLAGRNAAPPAAGSASRSHEKGDKRSMLQSLKNLRNSYLPRLVFGSQVKVFSRLKGLKAVSRASEVKQVTITSTQAPQLAPAPLPVLRPLQPTLSKATTVTPEKQSGDLDSPQDQAPGAMTPSGPVQKRKQPQEHDEEPPRAKARSTVVHDPGKRHIVQEWVREQQDALISPMTSDPDHGAEGTSPKTHSFPLADQSDAVRTSLGSQHVSTALPGIGGELVKSVFGHRSSFKHFDQASILPPAGQPLSQYERRDSMATTTNMTNRESIFSTCTSVGTGLTSSSEVSLPIGRRLHTESRSSSFFAKANPSPRSSVASSVPSHIPVMQRTGSSNSVPFVDENDLARHPLPDLPKMDHPLRSHPVVILGMDLANLQTAVVFDQVVKMGHLAQERRFSPKSVSVSEVPRISDDEATILIHSIPCASPGLIVDALAPIDEAPSDDGRSSNRHAEVQDTGAIDKDHDMTLDSCAKALSDGRLACRSGSGTPDSEDQQSDTIVTDRQLSREVTATPGTSVADFSEMHGSLLTLSEESDDSFSDITDYTDDSLFDAVEAFGSGLSNPLMLSIILTFKDDVLRLVLARINALVGNGDNITRHTDGATGGSSGSSSNSSLPSQLSPGQQRVNHKRRLNDNGDDGSREDGDDDDDRGKRNKAIVAIPSDLELRYSRLACPFFKRYLGTKWNGACCGPGFATVHRIKEHVYRKHDHPYCQRCHATFGNEKSLEEHIRADTTCTRKEGPLGHHGITPEQRKKLKSRKKLNKYVSQTETDRWNEVYCILFPEVPESEIPSPYYDLKSCEELLNPTVAAAFRQFLEEDVPLRVTRQLEEPLRSIPGARSSFVQSQLPDIIRACLREALDNVPSQLLPRTEPVPSLGLHENQPSSMTDAPESHNTAQIGAQFDLAERTAETPLGQAQNNITHITMASRLQPTASTSALSWSSSEDSLTSLYFPNPLLDGMVEQLGRDQFVSTTPFTSTGFPSAMLSSAPIMSPTLAETPFDGYNVDYAGVRNLEFQGSIGNMANTPFLFAYPQTPSPSGHMAGQSPDQNTPSYTG